MADPLGDDDAYARGLAEARAALGRPRPRAVPDAPADPDPPAPVAARRPRSGARDDVDRRDARIAELEAEVRRLRAALARVADEARSALDD